MEKVYKHKKTGQIAYYKDGVFKQNNCSVEIGVEPSSEFWTELTYKVLETKTYNCQGISNGTYTKITSVKRLSDGEVFSIGDKIIFRGLYGNNSEHKYDIIRGFDLKQDANLGILYHNGLVGIEKIQKYKEVLFTTEDGVEMFEGGVYYVPQRKGKKYEGYLSFSAVENYVHDSEVKRFASKQKVLEFIKDFNKEPILTTFDGVELFDQDVYYFIWLNKPAHGQEVNKIYKAIVRPLDGDTAWSSDAVFFSTEESAEEYILMNKPCLSLNDLLSVWGNDDSFDVYKESPMFQNFKNLAKTKL